MNTIISKINLIPAFVWMAVHSFLPLKDAKRAQIAIRVLNQAFCLNPSVQLARKYQIRLLESDPKSELNQRVQKAVETFKGHFPQVKFKPECQLFEEFEFIREGVRKNSSELVLQVNLIFHKKINECWRISNFNPANHSDDEEPEPKPNQDLYPLVLPIQPELEADESDEEEQKVSKEKTCVAVQVQTVASMFADIGLVVNLETLKPCLMLLKHMSLHDLQKTILNNFPNPQERQTALQEIFNHKFGQLSIEPVFRLSAEEQQRLGGDWFESEDAQQYVKELYQFAKWCFDEGVSLPPIKAFVYFRYIFNFCLDVRHHSSYEHFIPLFNLFLDRYPSFIYRGDLFIPACNEQPQWDQFDVYDYTPNMLHILFDFVRNLPDKQAFEVMQSQHPAIQEEYLEYCSWLNLAKQYHFQLFKKNVKREMEDRIKKDLNVLKAIFPKVNPDKNAGLIGQFEIFRDYVRNCIEKDKLKMEVDAALKSSENLGEVVNALMDVEYTLSAIQIKPVLEYLLKELSQATLQTEKNTDHYFLFFRILFKHMSELDNFIPLLKSILKLKFTPIKVDFSPIARSVEAVRVFSEYLQALSPDTAKALMANQTAQFREAISKLQCSF